MGYCSVTMIKSLYKEQLNFIVIQGKNEKKNKTKKRTHMNKT